MRVLGVDPGLTRCGLGVVEGGARRRAAGRRGRRGPHPVRRRPRQPAGRSIQARIECWLDTYRPDAVAVERVFSQHNVRTVMGTAQVSGVAIAAAARRGLPVALHTPSEVKAAVTGSGRADKAQVTAMVMRAARGSPSDPTPADAADALALAMCHIWRGRRRRSAARGSRRLAAAAASAAASAPAGRTP